MHTRPHFKSEYTTCLFHSFQGPILRERPRPLPLKAPQGFPPRPPPPFSRRPKEPRLDDESETAVASSGISSGDPESPLDLAEKAKEEMYMLPSNIRQSAAAERPDNYKLRLQVRRRTRGTKDDRAG